MKSVLISIRPKWCELIANGKKTVEVRKTRPNLETPFKVYIYCTKPNTKNPHELLAIHSYKEEKFYKANGKVIGEFVCDMQYFGNGKTGYSWHISDLVIYDKPRCLSDFSVRVTNKIRSFTKKFEIPPQSWCYVESEATHNE